MSKTKKWIDQKYECIRCHELKTLNDGSRRPEGFVCYFCLNKEFYQERAERRKARMLTPDDKARVMIKVLQELCHVADWYKLKTIAQNFNAKLNIMDAPDNIMVSNILKALGFKAHKRKHRGSYMHVFIDPNLIKEETT
jgi:hypothetical protein